MFLSQKLQNVRKAARTMKASLRSCAICPRKCGADRAGHKKGYCRAPANPVIYSYLPHRGEEPPISGSRGSGTIFFAHCNMKCIYCQNYRFSQLDEGKEISIGKLSDTMLYLQEIGCHNINLVNPTHFVPQISAALELALERGLAIPIVYNSGGYELVRTLEILDGIIDIYLPDMRYSDNAMAALYSDAPDYVELNRAAVVEMHRQVGTLTTDDKGAASKGLLIRLLALPENISGTIQTLRFIKEAICPDTFLSIMSQYYPTFKAYEYAGIARNLTPDEYKNIVDEAKILGLNNGWIQESPSESGRGSGEGNDTGFLGTDIRPKKDI